MMADKVICWVLVVCTGFWFPCYCSVIHCSEEGCGRTPSTVQVTEPPSSVTDSPEVSEHKLNCTVNETYATACLNKGYCFVNLIEDERRAQCHCPKKYSGIRCEYINPYYGWQNTNGDRIATAGIAASVVAAVLFVTVLTLIFVWHKHYKKRKEQEEKDRQKDQNGANGRLISNTGNPEHGNETPSTIRKNGSSFELQPLKESPV